MAATSTPPAELADNFGLNLRTIRLASGITVLHFAVACGIQPTTVNRIEQGVRKRPSDRTLHAMASALGLSMRTFLALCDHNDPMPDDLIELLNP